MYLDIETALADVSYPTDCRDIVENCGDRVVTFQVGEETVGEAIERCNAGELRTRQEARQTLLSALSEGAIGRKYYSDRDPPIPDSEWHDSLSL